MMRRSVPLFALLNLQPTMAIPHAQGRDEAATAVRQLYGSRWFGAPNDYLDFAAPQSHYVPFYLARGTFDGIFSATAEYRESVRDSDGKTRTETRYQHVPPRSLHKAFFDHNTQLYAGYRRDPKHVRALLGEHIPTLLKPMAEVDLAAADDMNAFEMTPSTLKLELKELLTQQAEELAKQQVREFHSSASAVRIHWRESALQIHSVTPVFVPAWVVPMRYGDAQYKAVVCGIRGLVSGPRLYNPELVARAAAVGAVAMCAVAARLGAISAFGAAFPLGSAATAVASYYAGFHLALKVPDWRITRRKREQERRKAMNAGDSSAAPGADEAPPAGDAQPGSAAWRRSQAQAATSADDAPSTHPNPQDPRGYYAVLGVSRHASTNEVKAAYRRKALRIHPDVAKAAGRAAGDGSGTDMATLNAAYAVLRKPARRRRYDDGDEDA